MTPDGQDVADGIVGIRRGVAAWIDDGDQATDFVIEVLNGLRP